MKRSDKLFFTGIIAEFNPLHKGHEYLIKKAKEQGPVAVVLSGNFVQRGDTAIAEKSIRTQAALNCGADLVLELPVLWSMSTAQNFALGGVSALNAVGCDRILFGSESGDIDRLNKTVDILESSLFSEYLETELKKGITFAAARQNAVEKCGGETDLLSGANNNLGIEYIYAARKQNYNIKFDTVSRIGANHDSLEEAEFVSASLLRQKILSGDTDFCRKYMPENVVDLFKKEHFSDIRRLNRGILAVLRTKSREELSILPDISEGVENKLFSSIRLATDVEELYNEIKVKRYTLARIRRMVLSAFLGFDNSLFMKPLPYVRILGFSKKGKKLLKSITENSYVPVVTKVSDINKLNGNCKKVFETECVATDLYGLSLEKPTECGFEFKRKIIITE